MRSFESFEVILSIYLGENKMKWKIAEMRIIRPGFCYILCKFTSIIKVGLALHCGL
jgi:hypothetical protein